MGKNLDTDSIFGSYLNKVLLKEAVKPTEETNDAMKGVTKAIPELQKMLNDPTASEEDKKIIKGLIDNAQKATSSTGSATSQASPITVGNPTGLTPQASVVDASKSVSNPYAKKVAQPALQPSSTQNVAPTNTQGTVTAQMPTGTETQAPLQVGNVSVGNPNAGQTPTPSTPNKSTPAVNNGSIVDYLAGKNQKFDMQSRAKLAAERGIKDYKGTAQQNTELLKKLQSGEKPTQQARSQTPATTQQGMGGAIGATSNVIAKGGNVVKNVLGGGNQPLTGIPGAMSKGVAAVGNVGKAILGSGQKNKTKTEEAEEIKENNNIARFVKCLSEKNYSQAHEYLKKIVNAKVEKNLYKVINKI